MSTTDLATRLERYRDLVDDWAAFLDACARPLPTVVWANPLRLPQLRSLAADGPTGADAPRTPEAAGRELATWLRRRGARVEPLEWFPAGMRLPEVEGPGTMLEYALGLFHVQEEVSLVPVQALAPRPGERILDLCAAPGGKTAQIAVCQDDRGTLVANDVQAQRRRALRANCERLGVTSVVVTAVDGIRFPLAAGPFDRILLDVPCSCEGNLRRTPDAAGRASDVFLEGRSGLQATLLGRAWKLLRPGGVLVYATCTFAPEENEMVLDHVLGEDAEIRPLELPGLRWSPGVRRWQGRELRADCSHLARLWPHLNDTGGFTVARVRKLGGPA